MAVKNSTMTMILDDWAELLRVHPRTMLRHIKREKNPYWVPNFNPRYSLQDIAEALECDPKILLHAIEGRDILLKIPEVLQDLNIGIDTLYYRKYEPQIAIGGVRRYSKVLTHRDHLERFVD